MSGGYFNLRSTNMEDYRFEMLEKAKDIINNLDESDFNRITIDLDDSYPDETNISIDIELIKDYGKDYN